MSHPAKPSRASTALDSILRENGPLAAKIRRGGFDRSVLSRLRNGHRIPELATAVKIHELTRGEIVPEDWLEPANREIPASRATAPRSRSAAGRG